MNTPISSAAALRTEQRFQALFEQAPFSVQLLSIDGRTLKVNRAWQYLWGTRLGHEARVMHDPAQALEAVKDARFDAFVLDIGLPGVDGHTLARLLRAQPNGTAATFIALTGYGSEGDKQRGKRQETWTDVDRVIRRRVRSAAAGAPPPWSST